jgi:hypothetical protein
MLGLAASHLCLSGGGDHEAEALEHRVKSIKLLNQALCKPPTSKTESDARFSTLMVLTFQSSYMPDGMLEVFHMIRGCMILTKTTLPKYAMSLFTKFASGGGDKKPHEVTENNSQPTSLVLINASASLKSLRDLCRTKFEKQYLGILENLVNMASVSNMDSMFPYSLFSEISDLVLSQRCWQSPLHIMYLESPTKLILIISWIAKTTSLNYWWPISLYLSM